VFHATLNPDPLGRRPYRIASFQSVAGTIWGDGLPEIIANVQDIQNSVVRQFKNNQAFSAGAQIAVDASRMPAGADFTKAWPGKVWLFEKIEGNELPIKFFQAASNLGDTMRAFEFFDNMADDISGIPKYTYGNEAGNQGAGDTASGLAMLMGNASKRIRDVISSIDRKVIRPTVEAFFTWNMLNHEDPTIKGDVQIVARGSAALMVKEQVQMRRGQFLVATNNPVDLQIMGIKGRAKLLAAVADTLHFPKNSIVPDELEMQRRIQLAQQQQAQAAAMAAGNPPEQGAGAPQSPAGQPPQPQQ
jgi:hypothetical protein